jgi:glycosyltransferase involved in cell wall biosynthesis
MPLVSICIPTYKQVFYLKKCLQSVIEQDFTDYELIISDDTPDDTVKNVVFDLLKDKAFRYINNSPALGSPANWNKAISEASGTYIKVLHHDDFFTHTYSLRAMVEHIKATKADFLFCGSKVWSPATDSSRGHAITKRQHGRLLKNPEFLFFGNWIGAPSATLYRKDPCLQYDEQLVWLVDVDFYISYLKAHKRLAFINQQLICTVDGTEHQVTGMVQGDKNIQVREHVLVFLKNRKLSADNRAYASFFDYLFRDLKVACYLDLVEIVPQAAQDEIFFRSVFLNLHKHLVLKRLKRMLRWSKVLKLLVSCKTACK